MAFDDFQRVRVSVGIRLGRKKKPELFARYSCEWDRNHPFGSEHDGYEYIAEFLDKNYFPELEGLAMDLHEKNLRPVFQNFAKGEFCNLTKEDVSYLSGRWHTLVGILDGENAIPRFDVQPA